MSYKLKNLKKAMDEHILMPEIDRELLRQAAQSRVKPKSTLAVRVLTAAAAIVLIVLSLSSLLAPILKPNIDSIGENPYTAQQPKDPVQDKMDNPADEIPENPEIPEGFFFNSEGVGAWGYMTLLVTAVYFTVRLFRKARRKETAHMLLTESGFLVYVIALIVLAYRPMTGGTFWIMDDSILHSSGSLYRYYGEPLISMHISTEAVYMAVFEWSSASLLFMASFSAAYPKLRKRGVLLLVLAAVMLLPWAWKAVCLDMDATQWRIMSNLVFYVLPSVAILMFLVPAVKRWMERFFKRCDRFQDLTAYSGASRKFWWMLIAAALLSLCLGSYYSGQELDGLTRHTEVTYGYNKYCDEEWFCSVNESYVSYREKMEAGDEQGALHVLGNAEDEMAKFAVLAMYEHQMDELTPDRLLMVWVDANLTTKRPFYTASIQLEYKDTPYTIRSAEDERLGQGRADLPISAIWFNAGHTLSSSMDSSAMITECEMRAFTLCIMPEQQVDTQDILKNVTMKLCIEQYPYFDFAMQKVYTVQSRLDGSVFDAENDADTHGRLTGNFYPVIVFGIMCLLIGLMDRRRKKETYIDDDEAVSISRGECVIRKVRICLGLLLGILLCQSCITVITALLHNMSFGVEIVQATGFVSFKNVLINSLNSDELSGMVSVAGNMILCYGLIWSIYRLFSPRHRGSRHWILLLFLTVELVQHIDIWYLGAGSAGSEELRQMARRVLPSLIEVSAAWLMTLVQNVYYKVRK